LPEVPKPIDPENQDTSNAPNVQVMTAEDGEWTAVQEDLPPISSVLDASHNATQYSSRSEEIACVSYLCLLFRPASASNNSSLALFCTITTRSQTSRS